MVSSQIFDNSKPIPFSNLPLLIQERFAELCDSQTFEIFSKINQKTKLLYRKRKTVKSLAIIDDIQYSYFTGDPIIRYSSFKNFHRTIEVYGELSLWMPEITVEDVKGIPKTYINLDYQSASINYEVFEHLIGPKLEKCRTSLFISSNIESKILQNKLRMLVKFLIPVKVIFLQIIMEGNMEMVKNEVLKLGEYPFLPNSNKPRLILNIALHNSATKEYFNFSKTYPNM